MKLKLVSRNLWGVLALAASGLAVLSLSGCAGKTATPRQALNSVVRDWGRTVAVGEAYDRGAKAAQNGDKDGFVQACIDLQRLGALQEAFTLARTNSPDGTATDTVSWMAAQARTMSDIADKQHGPPAAVWERESIRQYYAALDSVRDVNSLDADQLNEIGYPLADQGKSVNDYRKAEELTRLAVQKCDTLVAQNKEQEPRYTVFRWERATIRDSLAWALFRQGRFREALTQQADAVQEAEATRRAVEAPVTAMADLYFHFAEMYRATGQLPEARLQYVKTLLADPNRDDAKRALKKIGLPPRPQPRRVPPDTAPNFRFMPSVAAR